MEHIQNLFDKLNSSEILPAAAFFAVLFLVRFLLVRAVYGLRFKDMDVKKKWALIAKNSSLLLIVLTFILMWGEELQSLALSLAAVAVAVVIAFKEIIMCIVAAIIRASTNQFEIGDRVNIAGKRGEVTDYNFLVTTLFEIGPGESSNQYTGRKIKVPNALFLTESLFINPKGEHYTLHIFTAPVRVDQNLFKKQEIMLKAAQAVCAPYANLAEEYMRRRCRAQGVETPDLNPRVLYEVKDIGKADFHIRMPMLFNKLTRTENKILDMYLSECFKQGLEA